MDAIGKVGSASWAPGRQGGTVAELPLLEKKLSDCVNCASAATPEGKTQIDELNSRIAAIRERLHRAAVVTAPAPKPAEGQPGANLDEYA